MNIQHKNQSGFTLLEVLVALVIIAIALGAATRAAHIATDSALKMKQRLAATWVAQNRLAETRARHLWPNPGVSSGDTQQAGIQFMWQETVSEATDPMFRKVEVKVFNPDNKDYALATLVGYASQMK
jgi:general secretion pathway protein I